MGRVRGGVFSGAMVLAGISATLLSALLAIGIRQVTTLHENRPLQVSIGPASGEVAVPDATASASASHSDERPRRLRLMPGRASYAPGRSASQRPAARLPRPDRTQPAARSLRRADQAIPTGRRRPARVQADVRPSPAHGNGHGAHARAGHGAGNGPSASPSSPGNGNGHGHHH